MTKLIEIRKVADPLTGTRHEYRRFSGRSLTHQWQTDAPLSASDIEALRKDPHCFDESPEDPEAA